MYRTVKGQHPLEFIKSIFNTNSNYAVILYVKIMETLQKILTGHKRLGGEEVFEGDVVNLPV